MPLSVNARLNQRYKILEVIAVGGMGSIYKALDESLNIEVALKENLFSSTESTRQFHYEAKILANLKHPNLPRVTDHFSIPNQGQYLVMDFIYGEDLKDLIEKKGVLSERQARLIGAAICDALSYLHSQEPKIIHRDIKPGNIKITPNGDVFLVDFGLAKQARAGQETTTGAQALTPGYAPPEQYGQGTEPRSDIYSLGATLYAAVTGEVPVDALARTIGSNDIIPIQKKNKNISDDFVKCIKKAMDIDINKRYKTAKQFQQVLLVDKSINTRERDTQNIRIPALNFNELPTKSISENNVFGSLSKTNKANGSYDATTYRSSQSSIPTPLLILILAIVVVSGVWIMYRILSNMTQQPQVTQNIATATVGLPISEGFTPEETEVVSTPFTFDPSPQETQTESEIVLDSTPDDMIGGSTGVIAFASNRSGIPQIWTMKSDGTELAQLTDLPDGACFPNYSPDGQKLVITSPCRDKQDLYKGSALFIINADGTGMRPIISVPGGDFDGVWSPDGKKILFTSLRDSNSIPNLYVLDLEKDTTTLLTSTSAYDRSGAWSPDGSEIAFESVRLGVSHIWIMDAKGEKVALREFTGNNLSIDSGYMPDWAQSGKIIVFSEGSTRELNIRQTENISAPASKIITLSPIRDASFSPDSYWLAFEGQDGETRDIYISTINGALMSNLTNDEALDFHPDWQP
jgi:eukaryotic-like serine/threonine-protein kinase